MSEYNIQMNKYNALNTEYDQLYPATKIKNVDGLDTVLQSKPNPNLLDNWYFGNPVDQRQGRIVKPNTTYYSDNTLTTSAGTTSAYVTAYRYATGTASGVSYASFKLEDSDTAPTYYAAPENVVRGYTGAGYGPDRFYSDDIYGTTLITNDGLVMVAGHNNRTQVQFFDFVVKNDTKVTLSALYKGDIILDFWGFTGETKHADDWSVATATYTIPAGTNLANRFYCPSFKALRGSTCTVKAIKFELGPTQTLAHQDADGNWVLNEIPDYGEQLARCQRYCFDPTFGANPSYASLGIGRGNDSGDGAYIQIPTPVSMRTIPVIENQKNLYIQGAAVTNISVEAVSASVITVNVKANIQTTPTSCYSLQMSSGAKLLFNSGL